MKTRIAYWGNDYRFIPREDLRNVKLWQSKRSPKSFEALRKKYAPLLGKIVKNQIAGGSVDRSHYSDLLQEATLAFTLALDDYNHRKGPLTSHLNMRVGNALKQYALDYRNSFRIGRSSTERKALYAAYKLKAAKISLNQQYFGVSELKATSPNLADVSDVTIDRAIKMVHGSTGSIEEAYEVPSFDAVALSDKRMTHAKAMELIDSYISTQSVRNQDLLRRAFFTDDDVSNTELAQFFDVTQTRIGQIKRDHLSKMQHMLQDAGLTVEAVL